MSKKNVPAADEHGDSLEKIIIQFYARNNRVVRTTEIAKQCGVTPSALNNIFAGRYAPSAALAERVATVLGVPLSRLKRALTQVVSNKPR